jgi:hypothetical protein
MKMMRSTYVMGGNNVDGKFVRELVPGDRVKVQVEGHDKEGTVKDVRSTPWPGEITVETDDGHDVCIPVEIGPI